MFYIKLFTGHQYSKLHIAIKCIIYVKLASIRAFLRSANLRLSLLVAMAHKQKNQFNFRLYHQNEQVSYPLNQWWRFVCTAHRKRAVCSNSNIYFNTLHIYENTSITQKSALFRKDKTNFPYELFLRINSI